MTKKSFKPFDVGAAIENGDPRFITPLGPMTVACCRPLPTLEDMKRSEATDAWIWMGVGPLPDGPDDNAVNAELVQRLGDLLPFKYEFLSPVGPNRDWDQWVDVNGRSFVRNIHTGEMRWDLEHDFPANPVLHRHPDRISKDTNEKMMLNSTVSTVAEASIDLGKSPTIGRERMKLPMKLTGYVGRNWELWYDVGRIYFVDIVKEPTDDRTPIELDSPASRIGSFDKAEMNAAKLEHDFVGNTNLPIRTK